MSEYYIASGNPLTDSQGMSQLIRSEFKSVQSATDKLPQISGNLGKVVGVKEDSLGVLTSTEVLAAAGISVSSDELNYCLGLKGNIQSQIDNIVLVSGGEIDTSAVQGIVGTMIAAGTQSGGITVTYDDASGSLDFVLASMTDAADTDGTVTGKIFRVFDSGSFSIGHQSVAGVGGTSVGVATDADTGAVAIGETVTVGGNGGIGIGQNVQVGLAGIAIGMDSYTGNGVVIGTGAHGSMGLGDEVVIGRGSNGSGGVYVGNGITASLGAQGVYIGNNVSPGSDPYCVAIGNGAAVSAFYAVAVGEGANVTGNRGVAIGEGATAGEGGLAFGAGSYAVGGYCLAIGDNASVTTYGTTVITTSSTVSTHLGGHIIPAAGSVNTSARPTGGSGAFVLPNQSSAITAAAADTVVLYSDDITAGNTTLAIYTEGSPITTETPAATDSTLTIKVNGQFYKIPAIAI